MARNLMIWRIASTLVLAVLFSRSARPEEAFTLPGILIEETGEGSVLARAGITPGDVLVAWERTSSGSGGQELAGGAIVSISDWLWLETEIAPRGPLSMVEVVDGKEVRHQVEEGKWSARVRPLLAPKLLELYERGKQLIGEKNPEEGCRLWETIAQEAHRIDEAEIEVWIYLRMGNVWTELRRWDQALHAYTEALARSRTPKQRIPVLAAIGALHVQNNQFGEAENVYKDLLAVGESNLSESLSRAHYRFNLCTIFLRRGDLDKAESCLSETLSVQEKLSPGSLPLANTMSALGQAAWSRGNPQKAGMYFQKSLEIRSRIAPGSLEEAASLTNVGNVHFDNGDLDKAESFFHASLQIKQKLVPDSLSVGFSFNNLGNVSFERGDFPAAEQFHRRALSIWQKFNPEGLEAAATLHNLGNSAHERGDQELAEAYYRKSLAIREKLAPRSLDVAYSLTSIGNVARVRGDYELAEDCFERALAIREEKAPGSLLLAFSLHHLADLAIARGQIDEAEIYGRRALQIRNKLAPDSLVVADSLIALSDIASTRGQLQQAFEFIDQALRIRERLAPESVQVALALRDKGLLLFASGDDEEAARHQQRALKILRALAPGYIAEASALRALSAISEKLGKHEEAIAYLSQAIESVEAQAAMLGGPQEGRAFFRASYNDIYADLVDRMLRRGRVPEAVSVLERSRAQSLLAMLAERDIGFSADIPEELEKARKKIGAEYDRVQREISDLSPQVDRNRIELLAKRLHMLRNERNEIGEQIRKSAPRLAALRDPETLDLKGILQSLDAGTMVIAYSLTESRINMIVISVEGSVRGHAVIMATADLRAKVHLMLGLLQEGRSSTLPRRAELLKQVSRELFEILLQPAAQEIAASRRVLLLPDGPLHILPWGALLRHGTGETGERETDQYFVQWKPFHVATSATLFSQLRGLRQKEQDSRQLDLLAFGDPVYPERLSQASPGGAVDERVRAAVGRGFTFDALPATRREVREIAALYPGRAQVYLGLQATEERAKSLPRDTRIVHFATHATLDERFPLNSAVALTITEKFEEGTDNGLLQAWEIFDEVRINADLAVLSACESGLGQEMRGEGLIGLTRAFQYAGARSVLASLWKISDRTTAELMVRFYRHLKAGLPKDEALRAAQMELIRGPIQVKNERGTVEAIDASAPYFWAAFQLYGDWQ